MNTVNSADLRNNLANVLDRVVTKKEPVLVGRFGEPKAVLLDLRTYNWQKQVIKLVKNLNKLTASQIETLNILLDDNAREMLFGGLEEAEKGKIVSMDEFLKD